jgi:hypothetical protein
MDESTAENGRDGTLDRLDAVRPRVVTRAYCAWVVAKERVW